MFRSLSIRRGGWALLGLVAAVVAMPLPDDRTAASQPTAGDGLPDGLRFVPVDAAVFAYVDVAKLWDGDILKSIRKADPKTFAMLTGGAKAEFGVTPDDVKSAVLFVPQLKGPRDTESLGVVLTFRKGSFDKARLVKGVESLLPKGANPKVVVPDDRTAVVLLNLKEDEYGKPRAAKAGPLSDALKAAASGKYAAVSGVTLANLPDELRGDDLPASFRPFQPLAKAVTITATLDLEKPPTLDVKVKTGTAGQAVDCEKALGALLALIQEEFEPKIREFEKGAESKDLIALMKAAVGATKAAKFSTLGNETQLTLSLPGELPFGGAFVAARKMVQEASAAQASANNLKQIALAVHNYEATYQNFPPAAVCDKTGKPMLSWRVLILPYIEEEALFKQFKLDEPWDSENNKKLLAKMPKVYGIPGKTQPGDTSTHYRVFVGNGAGFDWLMGGKFANITDGTSNTLMCVTAADAVPWTKPDELAFDPEKDMTKLIGLVVNGKAQAAMFDGSVRTLKKIPGKEALNAVITRGGGEVVGDDF